MLSAENEQHLSQPSPKKRRTCNDSSKNSWRSKNRSGKSKRLSRSKRKNVGRIRRGAEAGGRMQTLDRSLEGQARVVEVVVEEEGEAGAAAEVEVEAEAPAEVKLESLLLSMNKIAQDSYLIYMKL